MQSIGCPAKTLIADSVFVDTNIHLYSFDARDRAKRDPVRLTGETRFNWQFMHELWRTMGTDFAIVERGWYWMDRAQLSYWDSLILASAERVGRLLLLSEDFQSGRSYEGVRVVSPFERGPQEDIR
jgi:predicted nucleic acid-binding protein